MKYFISFILLTCATITSVYAETRYISDKLFTYMHSGPSDKYRIIGTIKAGTAVTYLAENRSTGFTQIINTKGRKGWVKSEFISTETSLAERLPKIENELKSVKEKLTNINEINNKEKDGLLSSLEQRNQQIKQLEENTTDLNEQLIKSQSENRELKAKLDTQSEDLLLRYFLYGGGVAGLGLLFGLILPHIIPRKKRKLGGWS